MYEEGLRPLPGEAEFCQAPGTSGALNGEPGDLGLCLAVTIRVSLNKFLPFWPVVSIEC